MMKWFYVFAMVFLSAQLFAAGFDDEHEEKAWSEIEVQLPAFPEQQKLIQFQVGALSDTKYMIDEASLSVGADGVLRYTVVVVSSTGVQNISYEGMRCATAERRFYAFGQPDKTWSKAKSNKWVKVYGTSNNHHVELFTTYFCPNGGAFIRDAGDILRVLRHGAKH
jgi:hypothetical protein